MGLTGTDLARALFAPASVAVVGASDDATKTAGRPLSFLRRAGFGGRVYPVNPRRDTVQGERAWRSLQALPEAPEHVYIVAPTEAVLETVEAAAACGVSVATILAAGFSEAGPDGLAREAELRALAARTGIRLVGPSSLGVVDLRRGMLLTANAAFGEAGMPVGRTLMLSQSGSLIGAIASRGMERGVGFAGLISVGNETDLGIGEIGAATLDDPDIDTYLLFLEAIRHADALRDFALAASARGKGVIAYKVGRSAEASALALSHTGALAGEDDVAEAFFSDCGIARLDTLDGLIEAIALERRVPARARGRGARVGIVTTTGGGAAMAVDRLAIRGVDVVEASEKTRAALAAAGAASGAGRIIDLTLAGTNYKVMSGALQAALAAEEFDLVLAVVGSSGRLNPKLAVQPVVDIANDATGAPRPIAAFIVPEAPEALAMLAAAGVPAFRSPESAADAIAAVLGRRPPRVGPAVRPAMSASAAPGRLLDEAASYRRLAEAGIPHAPFVELTVDGPVPDLPFAFPVALKALTADLAHKSDVGGVALGLNDANALAAARTRIAAEVAAASPGLVVQRLLVQPMTSGLGEALVGYRVDPEVGPIVIVAAGGVLAEIYRDRAIRLAPVDAATAAEMIAEVRGLAALCGYRGRAAGDLVALAGVVASISRLAADASVAEAEINPVIVHEAGRGVTAVDAVVRATAADTAPTDYEE